MQAGASKEGIALAAKYADAVYSVSWDIKQARSYKRNCLMLFLKLNIQIEKLKFSLVLTYVGETHEKHYQKAELDQKLPIEDALKQLSFCSTRLFRLGIR